MFLNTRALHTLLVHCGTRAGPECLEGTSGGSWMRQKVSRKWDLWPKARHCLGPQAGSCLLGPCSVRGPAGSHSTTSWSKEGRRPSPCRRKGKPAVGRKSPNGRGTHFSCLSWLFFKGSSRGFSPESPFHLKKNHKFLPLDSSGHL